MDATRRNSITTQSKPFHPARSFVFPKRTIGRVTRYCQRSWFDKYPFLHYDVDEDAVFCHTCMLAVEQKKIRKAKRGDTAFVSLNKRININNANSYVAIVKWSCHALSVLARGPVCVDDYSE